VTPADPNPEQEINPAIFWATDNFEDIARVHTEGFEVDDDNEALPENRPALDASPIEVSVDGLLRGQRWVCFLFYWLYRKSMHSLHCGTLCLATTRLKDARCSSSSDTDWLGSLSTTLCCARRRRRLLLKPLWPPFTSS